MASSIKQSYRESDNDYIKSVRRTILIDLGFSCQAETAINEGFYEEKKIESGDRKSGEGDGDNSARAGIAKDEAFETPNLNEETNQRESLLH